MLNVQELERQWFRYKLKSYIPKIALFTLLVILSIIVLLFFLDSNSSSNNSSHISKVSSTPTPVSEEKKSVTKKTSATSTPVPLHQEEAVAVKKKMNTQERLVLQPSLNFINSLQYMPEESVQKPLEKKALTKEALIKKPTTTKESELKIVEHKNIKPVIEKNTQLEPKEDALVLVSQKIAPHTNFTINIQEEEADIQDVIKRFQNNKNPALSLFVAKRFYALKKYKYAYNYALITNNLNSDIKESWLIAAKSLSKLNKKDKAISLLTQYIDNTKSVQATMLLEQIKNGSL